MLLRIKPRARQVADRFLQEYRNAISYGESSPNVPSFRRCVVGAAMPFASPFESTWYVSNILPQHAAEISKKGRPNTILLIRSLSIDSIPAFSMSLILACNMPVSASRVNAGEGCTSAVALEDSSGSKAASESGEEAFVTDFPKVGTEVVVFLQERQIGLGALL